MKLVVGLGNPGREYAKNRHNAGFMVVDALSAKIRNSKHETLNKSKIVIFKSQNFMNESGDFVKKQTSAYHLVPSALFVVHDDLDIKLGEYKIQFGKGPKGHSGILDIEEKLETKDFWRVRVGTEGRHSEITESISRGPMRDTKCSLIGGKDYVLQDFTEEEREILDGTINKLTKELISSLQSPVSS